MEQEAKQSALMAELWREGKIGKVQQGKKQWGEFPYQILTPSLFQRAPGWGMAACGACRSRGAFLPLTPGRQRLAAHWNTFPPSPLILIISCYSAITLISNLGCLFPFVCDSHCCQAFDSQRRHSWSVNGPKLNPNKQQLWKSWTPISVGCAKPWAQV